jgi:uncharacterized cupredoxin-like copper-binding protein
MKITSTLLIGLLSMGLAHAHGDEKHAVQPHEENSGHAATLGQPGDPARVTRTVEVKMSDAMRYTPASIKVRKGETIRFLVKNEGRIKHELVLGTLAELREHAQLMRKFPEMEHDDPNAVSVEPGQTGELVWQFNKAGSFDFACLVPGHFEAGMRGTIAVSNN